MKRLYLALFLGMTLVLSACGAGNQTSPTPSPTAELSEPSVPAAAQPAADALTGSAEYTVERQDRSVANKDGSTALSRYFDLVQLTGDTPEIQAINDSLNGHCEEFFAENSGDVPLEKRADDVWLNTMDAAVTQNGDGLLSVNMTRNWYMGGVANTDYLGYTYDLSTGETVGLADLTGQDQDTLATTLREIVKAYMVSHLEVDWWDDAADTVDSRSLEDMIFWVNSGEIVLCFSTYDLSPGAYGPVIIPTGVMVEH
ncbi:Protein of uncharacterised function (DUF3298) [uncultured Flavonifractor sp.]|nr:Protein of uncharacterised function (DUF3298) [uncultured Flavonifractor sp.]